MPRKSKSANASLKVIAEESGFTMMTVSRALRGAEGVSAKNREIILKIAEKHKYSPNKLIHSIRSGQTRMIGVIFPDGLNFYGKILHGINAHLRSNGFTTVLNLIEGHLGEEAIAQEKQIIKDLVEYRVEGLILLPSNIGNSNVYLEEIIARKIPIVTIDRHLENLNLDFVGTDDILGGELAARHLLERGHKKFGLVTPPDPLSSGNERAQGFLKEARKHKIKVTQLSKAEYAGNLAALDQFLTQDKFSAVFATNDVLASEVYSRCHHHGISIPDELSVLGFGNLELTQNFTPPLSTFEQSPERIGNAAARNLLRRLKQTGATGTESVKLIAPKLISRKSVS